jgi:hypothetical protein
MTDHLHNVLIALTSKIGGFIGFFTGLFTVTTANTDIPLDVMQYVAFSVSNVQFPVQSILTIIGALTTSIFFIAQMYALAKGRSAEIKLAEEMEELKERVDDLDHNETP